MSAFVLAAVLSLFLAKAGKAVEEEKACGWMGGYEEKVCDVSLYRIVANPKEFDGRIVRVVGFFADGPAPLLFVSRDAYETSSTVDSIRLRAGSGEAMSALLRKNRSFVIVIGRYRSADRLLSEKESSSVVSGNIAVDSAGPSVGPWGYEEPPSSLMRKKDG